ALGLLGIAAFESGEYAGAIGYWERLLAGMPPGSEGARAIQGGIDRARERMQEAGVTASDTEAAAEQQLQINVRVELADELAEAFDDDAVVFVSARDPQGPPMPLFAQRLNKAELPAEVVLDASDALMPGIQLQQGQTLQLSARISANGDVMQASHESRAVTLTAGDESGEPTVLQIDRTL